MIASFEIRLLTSALKTLAQFLTSKIVVNQFRF